MSEIARSRVGVATYLVPPDPLIELAAIAALRNTIESCIADRELHLIVDLTGATLLNSEALELLLDAQEQLSRLGGEVRITNPSPAARDVFRITGLHTQIQDVTEGAEAPRSLAATDAGSGRRVGEILVESQKVSQEQLDQALELHRDGESRLTDVMIAKGWISERDVCDILSEQLGVPTVALRPGVFDPAVAASIDVELARRHGVVPLFRVRDLLYLATPDPQSVPTIDAIEDASGLKVLPVLATPSEIEQTLGELSSQDTDLSAYLGELEGDLELVESEIQSDDSMIDRMAEGSPVINLINGVIQRAVRDRASDIHIEPARRQCRIRMRVDGVLYTVMTPPADVHPALVSRLKVMAGLDIAERRLPQDGRIQVATGGRMVDLRFSSLPGIFGEKIVLRVLDKNHAILDVDRLGMTERDLGRFKALLGRSHGLVLVTGPTGSGKTTSLYASLHHLDSPEKNIVTIEDPVEYQIDTITQNQVRESIGLSFAKFLKHVLRQDPDIVMVGEIRERETAEIAVQASLTGHLVLSTLHTNDSIGAITRLIDMGIEPYLLSSSLSGVIAQRLVRTICPDCKTTSVAPPSVLEAHGIQTDKPIRLARGRGCASCYDSGYKGRIAIYEIVECTSELQRLIVSNPARDELDAYLAEHRVKRLVDDGTERALAGETTLEEVFRAVNT